jgi:hypothetical protein
MGGDLAFDLRLSHKHLVQARLQFAGHPPLSAAQRRLVLGALGVAGEHRGVGER